MGTPLATRISNGELSAMPSLLSADIRQWKDDAIELMSGYCENATRSKFIYVSDSKGNDSNDGLTSSAPVKTLSQAATLLASRGAGTQILLERGDIWQNQSITIGTDNTLLGAYGAGEKPVLCGATKIEAGASWTDQGNGRYSISIATTDVDLVFMGDPTDSAGYAVMRESPFQRKTSTANVEAATTGAYYATSSVLHIKIPGGGDPSDYPIWYRKRQVTAPAATSGVLLNGVDQCHVRNLRVLGYGNAVGDQDYNIQVTATDADTNLVSGCDILFNASHHCFGSYAGTGGGDITIWKDIEAGYCNADSSGASIGVSYCADGEQEFYTKSITYIGGPLDYTITGQSAVATTQTFLSHASGSPVGPLAFCIDDGSTHSILAGNACTAPLTLSNLASDPTTRRTWDEYTVLIFGEDIDGGNQAGNHTGFAQGGTVARINCKHYNLALTEYSTSGYGTSNGWKGAFINCTFEGDVANENGETFGWVGGTSAVIGALFLNCGMAMTWTGTATNEGNTNLKGFAGLPNNGYNHCLVNSVFTMIPNGVDATTYNTYFNQRLNFADNQAVDLTGSQGGGHYCAYWGLRPATDSLWLGYSSQTGYLDLHTQRGIGPATYPLPDINERPALTDPIVGRASYSVFSSEELEYDQTWQARTNDVLGALEVAIQTSGNAALYAMYRRRRRRLAGE